MENGVTWWVISIIRTSGAILTITALQIATASLAAPKSVMKTIVGWAAGAAAGAETPCCAGPWVEQEAKNTRQRIRVNKLIRRIMIERSPRVSEQWEFGESFAEKSIRKVAADCEPRAAILQRSFFDFGWRTQKRSKLPCSSEYQRKRMLEIGLLSPEPMLGQTRVKEKMYLPKDYWAGLAEGHGSADAPGFAPILHPQAPVWFN